MTELLVHERFEYYNSQKLLKIVLKYTKSYIIWKFLVLFDHFRVE